MKKRPLQIMRLFQINFIIFRNRLDTIVLSTRPLQSFSFLSYLNPWHWLSRHQKPRGEAIRVTLEQLGPVFVKFGQILSTRRDLLPADIADELEKLQGQVPPFSGLLAKAILEQEFNKPVDEIFATFDITPLASASIAQVHAATLHDGTSVVVKIVRPDIKQVIQRDISLLYAIAALTEKFLPHGKKLRPTEVIAEVEQSIIYELDLLHEGANASQLRRNFLDSNLLYVPAVFWDYSSKRILVMERIDGIPISDVVTLKQHGINLEKLAENGVKLFFTQALRDGFFHADMHPGNIFVSKQCLSDPQYVAVDFGIMGTLNPFDQRYLAEILLAFFRRDYRRVAELHIESGWVGANVRVDEFETAIRGVCEPIFGRPLKDISFGKVLLKLFDAARLFNMQVQPQLFLLQKTLLNIEGLGRQLYPELDLWSTARPYIEKWIRKQMGPQMLMRRISRHGPLWMEKMLEMPNLIHRALVKNNTRSEVASVLPENLPLTRKLSRQKSLGAGFGLIIAGGINYVLLTTPTMTQQVTNAILVGLGVLFIFITL